MRGPAHGVLLRALDDLAAEEGSGGIALGHGYGDVRALGPPVYTDAEQIPAVNAR